MPYVVIAGFFITTTEEVDMGGAQGSGSTGGKAKQPVTLTQGANEVSGYMVASGEGKMACDIGGVIVEGDYEGNEGDPCTANISVE